MRNQIRKISDKKRLAEASGKEQRLNYIPDQALKVFEDKIRSLVSIAESGGATVILSSFATIYDPDLIWSSKDQALANMSGFQKDCLPGLYNFTPGLTIPAIFDGLKKYNDVLHKVAVQKQLGWVDNANLVPHNGQHFVDRVHFTNTGAEKMAENFAPVIVKILKDKQSRHM